LSNYAREEGLEALSSLVNLRHLNIFHKDRYYRELLPLQKLEVLILHQDIHAYLDVSYIAQLHSLKELEISSGFMIRESIENTEQLKNLVNLEELKIGGVVDLDISWMTHLQKLKRLSFVGCTINDVSPLLELPNLISVDFYLTPVTDITPLLESKSIKRIDRLHVEEDDVPSRSELFHLFRERGIEFFPFYSDR
jgi:Leucine-rich repeat (LRR) protein